MLYLKLKNVCTELLMILTHKNVKWKLNTTYQFLSKYMFVVTNSIVEIVRFHGWKQQYNSQTIWSLQAKLSKEQFSIAQLTAKLSLDKR